MIRVSIAWCIATFLLSTTFCAAEPKAPKVEEVVAFPGCEGAGRFTTGGRGGQVVRVTSLKAKGPGSLAEAVDGPNRIVVFDVSGVIDLTKGSGDDASGGKIVIEHPNITIAGQTAPGEGICVRGGMLNIGADNVIIRHLRSRRGWVRKEDSGDSIVVKPASIGEEKTPKGLSPEAFEKTREKKEDRGKIIHDFAEMKNVVIDHCSATWATDENLTVTHTDRTTVSWSIAAEGCDYTNPKQTPPNHSEGSLWGSEAPNGRATMHHVLYAHNRLRNPRTTGGDDVPPVLNFYNNVVYDWSEYSSHTGSQRVLLNWINNYYKAGLDTPDDKRAIMFEFHGDRECRLFASGNFIEDAPKATRDNRLAVTHSSKFKKVDEDERLRMIVDTPFSDAPTQPESATDALASVLDDAGATLPARDAVDLRILQSVRDGEGHVLDKETDLKKRERWPDYRSLEPLPDFDEDGLPDFWERQFGLDPFDALDSAAISHGYANIEHYANSTDPASSNVPVVFVSATISRATKSQQGQWRITRHGDTSTPLTVRCLFEGDAKAKKDYERLPETVTIPAGATSATIDLVPFSTAREDRIAVLSLVTDQDGCFVGCPARSLIVIND